MDPDQLCATVEEEQRQLDMKLSENQAYASTPKIPVEPNQCYVTTASSVDPDQLYATVEERHEQQVVELTENQAYAATLNIPVEPNQCYGTTTQEPAVEEYDYVIA